MGKTYEQAKRILQQQAVMCGGVAYIDGKELTGKNGYYYLDGELVTDIEGLYAKVEIDEKAIVEEMGRV